MRHRCVCGELVSLAGHKCKLEARDAKLEALLRDMTKPHWERINKALALLTEHRQ